jgi:hypothetical protein
LFFSFFSDPDRLPSEWSRPSTLTEKQAAQFQEMSEEYKQLLQSVKVRHFFCSDGRSFFTLFLFTSLKEKSSRLKSLERKRKLHNEIDSIISTIDLEALRNAHLKVASLIGEANSLGKFLLSLSLSLSLSLFVIFLLSLSFSLF